MWTVKMVTKAFPILALVPTLVLCVASTDSLQDADPAQSGYLPNHNLHPATVGSAIFGQLWKNTYNAQEDWYAKPLVFTPAATGRELVFIASNQNIIRTIDGLNGTLVNSRTIQPPFLQSDIGCGDIPNYIGITGTPIIDPATETVYFFSKGYKGGASGGGVLAGQYSFYAVDFNTLQDKPGFPVIIDGHYSNNDPTRYFLGGTVLQRPSLTSLNGVVVGGFGGHCDLFNYTGMLVSVSKTPGVGVTGIFAMESKPGAPTPQPLDYTSENGGKAGIWQSGMGLATDASRIFLNTGNGQGHQNGDVPASGRVPLSTLDETVVNIQVSSNGTFSLTDYFEPFEYVNMDAADRDLGSGGVALLDPTVFAAPTVGISRFAVTVGKNGKCYIMDANQLGGFKQGPSGTDGIVQTITAQNAVFGGPGSYPLEGGFIYFTPVGYPTQCFKFSIDPAGKPVFVFFGQAKVPSAGRVGVGIPTLTTYKGQAGTGILWVTDVNLGLRAFKAVPENQILVPINLPATPGLGKFGRPGFGNGRVYITTRSTVFCLGSPVALPLACTQPVDFGGVAIGTTSTINITCITQIAITKVNGCTTQDKTFQCLNSTLPAGPLAKGENFTFPVVWNLTQASINDAQNASYGHVLPGVQSTVLDLYTTNTVAGYSIDLPISIGGTTISKTAFLAIAPQEVDFGGIVVDSSTATSGLEGAIIISNLGSQVLVFTGFAWEDGTESSISHNMTTASDGSKIVGNGFTSSSFPNVGNSIPAGGSITVPLLFKTTTVGSYSSILNMFSNGGNQDVLFVGSASTAPIANISVSTIEGGWDDQEPLLLDFGNVLAGTTVTRSIRLCNVGGSAMAVTKSKPPTQPELTASSPTTDLHEGQSIPINACALGPVKIIAAFSGPNRPSHTVSDVWTLNADGLNSDLTPFGVHDVAVTANIVSRQIGPILSNGSARYQYLGCYADGAGRQLATKLTYSNAQQNANENGQCQKDCYAKGYIFAGTEFHIECWCGNTLPSPAKFTPESAKYCAFSCAGDATQACGGTGTCLSVYYDITRYNPNGGAAVSSSVVVISSSASSSSFSSPISSSSLSSLSSSSSTTLKISATSSSSSLGSVLISSSAPTSITTSTSASATPTPGLGPFTYLGCYVEPSSGPRALKLTLTSNGITNEMCAGICVGSVYFGTEYSRECYCGNALATGTTAAPAADCKLACAGNKNQICGGSLRLSLYRNSASGGQLSSSSSGVGGAAAASSTVVKSSFPVRLIFANSSGSSSPASASALSSASLFSSTLSSTSLVLPPSLNPVSSSATSASLSAFSSPFSTALQSIGTTATAATSSDLSLTSSTSSSLAVSVNSTPTPTPTTSNVLLSSDSMATAPFSTSESEFLTFSSLTSLNFTTTARDNSSLVSSTVFMDSSMTTSTTSADGLEPSAGERKRDYHRAW